MENTRPFRYDLNRIPYDYIAEVRNRFKGLDLIDRVPEELWAEVHDIVQKAVQCVSALPLHGLDFPSPPLAFSPWEPATEIPWKTFSDHIPV